MMNTSAIHNSAGAELHVGYRGRREREVVAPIAATQEQRGEREDAWQTATATA